MHKGDLFAVHTKKADMHADTLCANTALSEHTQKRMCVAFWTFCVDLCMGVQWYDSSQQQVSVPLRPSSSVSFCIPIFYSTALLPVFPLSRSEGSISAPH